MRRWLEVSLVLLVLGGAVWWMARASSGGAHAEGPPANPAQAPRNLESRPPRSLLGAGTAQPTQAPRGVLSIRGRVLGPEGPVSGAWVEAVKPGLLLSARVLSPCGCHAGTGLEKVECSCDGSQERLESWLEMYRGDIAPVAHATTDAEGRFSLEGLEEGAFHVWAEGAPGVAVRPEVRAGTDGVDLWLGGASLDVTVLDEDGAPADGARVTALCLDHGRLFEALTAEDGRGRLDSLPAGEYHVLVLKEGWFPELTPVRASGARELAVTLHRARRLAGRVVDGESPVPGARVVLAAEHRQLEARTDDQGRFAFDGLRPEVYEVLAFHGEREAVKGVWLVAGRDAPEVVLDLARPSQLRGVVRDEEGRPIANAVLSATEPFGPRLQRRKLAALADAGGAYRLGPLADGEYTVRAFNEGFLTRSQKWRPGDGPLDFVLQRALLVEGDVVDPEGRPLERAFLRVLDTSRNVFREVGLARTGADGTFQVEVARAGDFLLTAYHADFMMAKLRVTVPRRGVRLVMSAGAELTGEVVDSRGQSVAKADVRANPVRGGDPAALEYHTTTDAQGHFSLRGLPAGRYGVVASHAEEGDFRGVESAVELAPTASAQVRLVLSEGLSVAGRVVDTEGRPLPESLVIFFPPADMPIVGFQPTTTTGPDGRFRQGRLAPGEYEVLVTRPGYRAAGTAAVSSSGRLERFHVTAGAQDVRWVLQRDAEVRGRVTREDGSPVTRFSVDGLAVEDAEGRFARGLYGGATQRLTLTAPDLATTRVAVTARQQGGDVDLGVVVMRAGDPVRGRIVDAATGAPVGGALVDTEDAPGKEGRQVFLAAYLGAVKSATDGTFSLRAAGAGPRTLVVTHPGHVQKRVALAPGQTQVQVSLDAGARVRGRLHASDSSYTFCVARLDAEDGSSWHEAEFPCTGFELRGVPAGAYVASLRLSPRPEPEATVPSRRVQVPAQGTVSVDFEERREGATLKLRSSDDAAAGDAWVLVSGALGPPADHEAFERATRLRHEADYQDGFWTFPHLPAGTYTLFLVRYRRGDGDGIAFHREVLQLPATGEVTREVSPRWQALAREASGG
jgi:hypothetical protein